MVTVIYEDAAFNAESISKMSEADFIKGHMANKSSDLSEAQLKEVHALAVKNVAAAPKVEHKPDVKVIKEEPSSEPQK